MPATQLCLNIGLTAAYTKQIENEQASEPAATQPGVIRRQWALPRPGHQVPWLLRPGLETQPELGGCSDGHMVFWTRAA